MTEHKKYFKTTMLSFIFGLVLLFLLGQFYKKYIFEENKFLRVPDHLKIINLGSSHGKYGFLYPEGEDAFNFAIESQTYYYDLKILKKYSDRLEPNSIVLIPVSIFSFYDEGWLDELNESYYGFLDFKDIYNGKKDMYYLWNFSPILYSGKKLIEIFQYFQQVVVRKQLFFKENTYPKDLDFEGKVKEAQTTSKRHLAPENLDFTYINEILEFCEKKNFKAIMVGMPQSYLYNDQVGDFNYRKRIKSKIGRLKIKPIYLDYSHDARFERDLDLFLDDDHLNEKGAKKFTTIILNDLKQLNLKQKELVNY
ncbi:MAG: hypothetical protein RR693_04705 [Cetobacterium sp.]|uniref:hypothetical protein n=1 Tax=Cetobacterium sp. TaxID=2071632 RepID=UPI002FC66950